MFDTGVELVPCCRYSGVFVADIEGLSWKPLLSPFVFSRLTAGGGILLTATNPEGDALIGAKPPEFTAVKPDEDIGLGASTVGRDLSDVESFWVIEACRAFVARIAGEGSR